MLDEKLYVKRDHSVIKRKVLLGGGLLLLLLFNFSSQLPALELKRKENIEFDQRAFSDAVVECSGKIIPEKEFSLILKPGEQIVDILVEEGMTVQKDTPLAKLGNDGLFSRYLSMQEKLQSIKEQKDRIDLLALKIAILSDAVSRLKKTIEVESRIHGDIPKYLADGNLAQWIFEKKQKEDELAISKKELELLENQFTHRKAAIGLIEKNLAAVRMEMDQLLLRAPFDGRIVNLHPNPSRAVSGEKVMQLQSDGRLNVKANVWQNQLKYVHPGDRVKIFPDFFNKVFMWGTVNSIGAAESATVPDGYPTFPLRIDLKKPWPDLQVGMTVSIRILSSREK